MKEIIEIIENLQNLSGNAQLDYLKSHKDNKILKEVLQYTYDDSKNYNISEAKLNKALSRVITTQDIKQSDIDVIDKSVWEAYKKSLDELSSKKGVCDADVDRLVSEYFIHCEYKSNILLRNILFRDLRINMGVKLFSKVWNDFCVRWSYMGAKPFNMKNLSAIKYPAFAQTKLDGMFANIIVDVENQKVRYVSRQGKEINIYGSLEKELLKIKASENFVLTGELLVWDKENNKPLSRKIGNGILMRDDKTADELDAIRTVVWDIIPYKDFIQGKYEVPYKARYNVLDKIFNSVDKIKVVDNKIVNTIEEALALFEEKYAQGEEGIIVKEQNLIWKDGKPKGCVKIKSEKETDLRCVGFDEGSGAYVGMLGAIKCQSEDGLLIVDVGTGLTEENRKEFWNNKDKYLNKILTVKYNEKIKDKKKDTWSLFLPVFIEWRDFDKDKADKLEDIK